MGKTSQLYWDEEDLEKEQEENSIVDAFWEEVASRDHAWVTYMPRWVQ